MSSSQPWCYFFFFFFVSTVAKITGYVLLKQKQGENPRRKNTSTHPNPHTKQSASPSLSGFLDLQCLRLSLAPFFFPLSVRALWLGIRLGLTSRMRPRKIECGDCFGTEDDDEDDGGSRTMYLIRFLLPNLVLHHLLLLLLLLLLTPSRLFHSTHTPPAEEEEEQKPKENYQTIATEKQE
jgi:hypothetical protein